LLILGSSTPNTEHLTPLFYPCPLRALPVPAVKADQPAGWLNRGARALLEAARLVILHNVRIALRVGLGATCRARLLGEERVPLKGGLVVAANHTSFADPVVLQTFFPRFITYMMTEIYYYIPVLYRLLRFWGVLCLKEKGLNRDAIRAATGVLERGGAIGIFPEGAISRDGLIHDAQPGIALLAQRARVPILPVGLAGIERFLPPDVWHFHRSTITMCVGKLICPEGQSRDELAKQVSCEIRAAARLARQRLS